MRHAYPEHDSMVPWCGLKYEEEVNDMGRFALEGMLEQGLDAERALAWHLNSNHFPPIPEVFDAAVEAIDAGMDEDWERPIELPDGVSWREQTSAPAWACIEGWHLDEFIYAGEEG